MSRRYGKPSSVNWIAGRRYPFPGSCTSPRRRAIAVWIKEGKPGGIDGRREYIDEGIETLREIKAASQPRAKGGRFIQKAAAHTGGRFA
jgi:hypothetical protein